MSHLNLDTRIIDTKIPASHDSSCYPTTNVFQDFANQWVGAVTQLEGYTAQLNTGVRYFDMRIARHNGDLYMHHNTDWFFETFDQVLSQIRAFSDAHPGEYIFLDLDFDTNDASLSGEILTKITNHLDESRISTAHVNGGLFNPNVTWRDLGQARFLIAWSLNNWGGKTWMMYNEYFRYSPYDDFDKHDPNWITNYLTNQLAAWDKSRLMVSQAINTPLLSFVTHPGELDANAQATLNYWAYTHLQSANIIMRDFVNAGYNSSIINAIISANHFSSDPYYAVSDTMVRQQDTVRFRVLGTDKYMSLGGDGKMTLTTNPDQTCNFMLRDHDYSPNGNLPYSGNLDADTTDCQGNFRMVSSAPTLFPNDTTVISIKRDENNALYNGISWSDSADYETFTSFDPDKINNDGPLYYGSRVILRNMIGSADNFWQKVVHEMGSVLLQWIPFAGSAFNTAMQDSQRNHIFVLVTYDGGGTPYVYAASPGPDYATSFIIEQA